MIRTARAPRPAIALGEGPPVAVGAGEHAGFGQVRRHHRRQRQQASDEDLHTLAIQERRAGAGAEDGVDDEWGRVLFEVVGNCGDDVRREERAGLGDVHPDIRVDGVELRGDDRGRQLVHREDRLGVLRGHPDDRGHPMASRGGKRLQVRLDAGATAGVGRGDGEAAGRRVTGPS